MKNAVCKKFLLCCLVVFALNIFSGVAKAETLKLTLEDALDRAMKANYDIKIAQEKLNQLKAMIGEARSGALPQLNATANYTRTLKKQEIYIENQKLLLGAKNSITAGATLTQPLYAAGKVWKALKAAQSETLSSEATLKDVQQEVALQVKKIFNGILLTDRVIGVTKQTLAELNRHLSAIRTRYDQGLDSDYTLMRQEVEVANIEPQLADAVQSRIEFVNFLRELLALPETVELELSGRLNYTKRNLPSMNELLVMATSLRQDLTASREHLRTLNYNVGIERGGYLPTLNAFWGASWQAQTENWHIGSEQRFYTSNVGVQFSLPIFDGLKTHYRISEAQAMLRAAQNQNEKLQLAIKSEVMNARAALETALARETTARKALNLAKRSVEIAGARFEAGLMSQLELNDTIISRDTAEKNWASAVYDCLDADATLTRTVGGNL